MTLHDLTPTLFPLTPDPSPWTPTPSPRNPTLSPATPQLHPVSVAILGHTCPSFRIHPAKHRNTAARSADTLTRAERVVPQHFGASALHDVSAVAHRLPIALPSPGVGSTGDVPHIFAVTL